MLDIFFVCTKRFMLILLFLLFLGVWNIFKTQQSYVWLVDTQPRTLMTSTPFCGTSSLLSPGKPMWSPECTAWYNRGNWTLRSTPRSWDATFSYHPWKKSKINTMCEYVGKSAEFQSLTNKPKVFEAEAFLRVAKQVGRREQKNSTLEATITSILFVGDSVSRQSFAVLLEGIGIPKEACAYMQVHHKLRFPSECNWTTTMTGVSGELSSLTLILRMHNTSYGTEDWTNRTRGKWTNQTYFAQADIIFMNFGIWYVEQQEIGIKSNHTPLTYLPYMARLMEEIQAIRQPHQLIVFRESSKNLNRHKNTKLVQLSQRLRPLLVQNQIPLVTNHNSIDMTRLESHLFYDSIHFCEPSVPLAWMAVFTYIISDWGLFLARCNGGNCTNN